MSSAWPFKHQHHIVIRKMAISPNQHLYSTNDINKILGSHIVTFSSINVRRGSRRSPGPEVIKPFSCSAQLRLKLILLINIKMLTIVDILTFISRINYRFWSSKPSISIYFGYFGVYEQFKFYDQLS